MSAAGHELTISEYIDHHITNLSNIGSKQEGLIDFSVIHYDTVFWSIVCAIVAALIMYFGVRNVTSGVPGRLQAVIEVLSEMVNSQARQIHHVQGFVAPFALTVFIWIFLQNALDFLPVDLFGQLFAWTGLDSTISHHRVVPTSDLNGTVGIALGVVIMMFYFGIKIHGFGGFMKQILFSPFGPWVMPFNLALNIIEYAAKIISLSMRLWGNMFAGELIFLMIALLGATATMSVMGAFSVVSHIIAGSVWAIFHILVIFLQAFIFMTLTLVYLGQAHEGH